MHRGLKPIMFIVVLDAMGIGIVAPTLPGLLRSLLHGQPDVTRHYGFLLASYAATMLLASPALGVLSDRFGRRPVLLFSLVGTAFDDLVMALAPTLSILYLGRTLAGLTGANLTVANAYIADLATEGDRASAFGRINAAFGIGFIAGPLLGGLAGAFSLRAPFYTAAALNVAGAIFCSFALPESRVPGLGQHPPITFAKLNPFASFRALHSLGGVSRLLILFGVLAMAGQVPTVLWVIYGAQRFGWAPATIGLSFAVFGLLHALCQAFLPGLAERRFGYTGSVMIGMALESLAYVLFSAVRSTSAAFGIIPLLSIGGISEPAVQAMLTGSVAEERQGELQGVLTSIVSLIAIVGPLLVVQMNDALRYRLPGYPGAIWLFSVLLYLPCILLLWLQNRRRLCSA